MKNTSSVIWGLILVAVGIILGGNALGIFDIKVFFDGWWTLFIIVPCVAGLFTEKDKTGNLIGLTVGVFLLLACQKVVSFDMLWKMILPVIIVLIGLTMIGKNLFNRKFNEAVNKLNEKINKDDESGAVFGGQNINMAGKKFNGRNLNAIFGGLKLDLREAKIEEDVIINASAIFGGIEILVPENVFIETKSNSIFGGVSNKKSGAPKEKAPTIYVNGMALFGGIEVK